MLTGHARPNRELNTQNVIPLEKNGFELSRTMKEMVTEGMPMGPDGEHRVLGIGNGPYVGKGLWGPPSRRSQGRCPVFRCPLPKVDSLPLPWRESATRQGE